MNLLSPYNLTCEHLASPQGLNTARPRFSWALSGAGRNRRQSAYQLIVGEDRRDVLSGQGKVWDSGKVGSSQSQLVNYDGPPLRSRMMLCWAVRVWDENDAVSEFSQPASMITGLMQQSDWAAAWIGKRDVPPGESPNFYRPVKYDPAETYNARPPEYLRRQFGVEKPIRRATAYTSALGVYYLHLNGKRISSAELMPGWTDYHKRVEYQIHDLTTHLQRGQNVVGAVVGEGWYCGRVGLTLKRQGAHYGPKQLFICQLEIEYDDGSQECIATDLDWQVTTGPIIYSDLLLGERYDSDRENPGWDLPDFRGPVGRVELADTRHVHPQLDGARAEPIIRHEALRSRFLHRAPDGSLIFDLGQNIVGFNRLEVARALAEGRYVMRHGEALDNDGNLYTANLRSALQEDIYNAASADPFSFEPSFTFHGYRYVALTGPNLRPEDVVLTGIAIHNAMPQVGSFNCGVGLVNRLQSNVVWSTKGNFISVPTDCPQRDERLGWLCDAQVFLKTAFMNFGAAAFITKWLKDVADAQQDDGAFTDVAPSKPHQAHWFEPPKGAPGWADGGITMPWDLYSHYGDSRILEESWSSMQAFMDYLHRNNPDELRENALNRNYGDWFSIGTKTDNVLVAQAYWAHDAKLMARMATVLGKTAEAKSYHTLFARLSARFRDTFVRPDGCIGTDTQSSYLLPLAFGLLDETQQLRAAERLVAAIDRAKGHLTTGFLGIRHLAPVLTGIGRPDLAYALLLNEEMPSWLFSIKHADATTIWERWDFFEPGKGLIDDPKRSSLNHYSYGAIGEWLFSDVAGIDSDPDRPGFAHVMLRPHPTPALGEARAVYQSPRGKFAASWIVCGDLVRYACLLPPNTTGTLTLTPRQRSGLVDAAGAAVDGTAPIELGSGEYTFSWPLN